MTLQQDRLRILKAKIVRVAAHQPARDVFKKNKINRDLDADTAGNNIEQDIMDMLNNHAGPGNERAISKAFKNRKKTKGGGSTFSFTTKG
jgi:hypothetical protein